MPDLEPTSSAGKVASTSSGGWVWKIGVAVFFVLSVVFIVLYATTDKCKECDDISWKFVQTSCQTVPARVARVTRLNVTQDWYIYEGIRYGQPPVGKLRWEHAKAPSGSYCESTKTFTANKACVQDGLPMSAISEDCLNLNILVHADTFPLRSHKPLKPVFFFMYGGGLGSGKATGTPGFGKSTGVYEKDFVSVYINYRLGYLGFLALETLSQASTTGVSGNYGLSDAIQALKWVKENISKFGGDPNKITIAGSSSGGTLVYGLHRSPLAKNLFARSIAISGSAHLGDDFTLQAVQKYNKGTCSYKCPKSCDCANCNPNPKATCVLCTVKCPSLKADCLRKIGINDWKTAKDSNWGVSAWEFFKLNTKVKASMLNYDGKILKIGHWNDVPMIIGSTKEESSMAIQYGIVPPQALTAITKATLTKKLTDTYDQSTANTFVKMYEDTYATSTTMTWARREYRMYTDLNFICPNLDLATTVANRANPADIYFYIYDVPTTSFPYSVHGIDAGTFMGPTAARKTAFDQLKKIFNPFISSGTTSLKKFTKTNKNINEIVKGAVNHPTSMINICKMFKDQNMYKTAKTYTEATGYHGAATLNRMLFIDEEEVIIHEGGFQL